MEKFVLSAEYRHDLVGGSEPARFDRFPSSQLDCALSPGLLYKQTTARHSEWH